MTIKMHSLTTKLLQLFTLFQLLSLTLSDTCTDVSPTSESNCFAITLAKGYQCCLETQTYGAIVTLKCKSYTDADVITRTTTEYSGYKYSCPGTKTVTPTPSVAPTPVVSPTPVVAPTPNSGTTMTGGTSGTIPVNAVTLVDSYKLSCANTKPLQKSDCTSNKYQGYLCCRIKYLPLQGDTSSYCFWYTQAEAEAVVKLSSKYYMYECGSFYLNTISLILCLAIFYIYL